MIRNFLFLILFLFLLAAWVLAWVAFHVTIGAIHLLLVLALIALVIHIFRWGRRTI